MNLNNITLKSLVERDGFINERHAWILAYSSAKYLKIYYKYIRPKFPDKLDFFILINSTGFVSIIPTDKSEITIDGHNLKTQQVGLGTVEKSLFSREIQIQQQFQDECDKSSSSLSFRNGTTKSCKHELEEIIDTHHDLNLEKELVSALGLHILRAMFNRDVDISQSVHLDICATNKLVESNCPPSFPEPGERSRDGCGNKGGYVYIPNSCHNPLVSEELIDLLDAMLIDDEDDENEGVGYECGDDNNTLAERLEFISSNNKDTTLTNRLTHHDKNEPATKDLNSHGEDEGIDTEDNVSSSCRSSIDSFQNSNELPFSRLDSTILMSDHRNCPHDFLNDQKSSASLNSSSALGSDSIGTCSNQNSSSPSSASDDEEHQIRSQGASITCDNNNHPNGKYLIEQHHLSNGKNNGFSVKGGLTINQVIQRCLLKIRTYYPTTITQGDKTAAEIESLIAQDLRLLAMGIVQGNSQNDELNTLYKVFRDKKHLNLSGLLDLTGNNNTKNKRVETTIPITEFMKISDKTELPNPYRKDEREDSSCLKPPLPPSSTSHYSSSSSKHSRHSELSYFHLIDEIKHNFPVLRKTPEMLDKKLSKTATIMTPNDVRSTMMDELKHNRPNLKSTANIAANQTQMNKTIAASSVKLTLHDKIMMGIRGGKSLKHVQTLDKSKPQIMLINNEIVLGNSISSSTKSPHPIYNLNNEYFGMDDTIVEDEEYFPTPSTTTTTPYLLKTTKTLTHRGVIVRRASPPNNALSTAAAINGRNSRRTIGSINTSQCEKNQQLLSCRRLSGAKKKLSSLLTSPYDNDYDQQHRDLDLNIEKNPNILNHVSRRLTSDAVTLTRSRSLRHYVDHSAVAASTPNALFNDKTLATRNNFNRRSFNSNPRGLSSSSTKQSATINLNFIEFCAIRKALHASVVEEFYNNDQQFYDNLKAKKVCFNCKKTLWSIFGNQGTNCSVCSKILCSRCYDKVIITPLHLSNISTKSLTPSAHVNQKLEKCQNFYFKPSVLTTAGPRKSDENVSRRNSTTHSNATTSPPSSSSGSPPPKTCPTFSILVHDDTTTADNVSNISPESNNADSPSFSYRTTTLVASTDPFASVSEDSSNRLSYASSCCSNFSNDSSRISLKVPPASTAVSPRQLLPPTPSLKHHSAKVSGGCTSKLSKEDITISPKKLLASPNKYHNKKNNAAVVAHANHNVINGSPIYEIMFETNGIIPGLYTATNLNKGDDELLQEITQHQNSQLASTPSNKSSDTSSNGGRSSGGSIYGSDLSKINENLLSTSISTTPILTCNECMLILRKSYLITKLAKK